MVGCTSDVSYPVAFMKLAKSIAMNCGPLSVMICSGGPYEANMPRSTSVVFTTVVDDIS